MSNQIKSKNRVRDRGEVFTNEREVKAMCDLVNDEAMRIDSRFLEPACGDGNFLVEILTRKLENVKKKYKKSVYDFEKQSLIAVSSMYGVDILMDNVLVCQERLYNIWNAYYKNVCKDECSEQMRHSIKFILSRNILCGNALTLKLVNPDGTDRDEPIVFSEWAFITGPMLQRSDYTFADIIFQNENRNRTDGQLTLFDMLKEEDVSTFLQKKVSHYKELV